MSEGGFDISAVVRNTLDEVLGRFPEPMREPIGIAIAIFLLVCGTLIWISRVRHGQLKNKELEARINAWARSAGAGDAQKVSDALDRRALPEETALLLAQVLVNQSIQRGGAGSLAGPGSGPTTPVGLPITFASMAQSSNPEDRRALGYLVKGQDDKAIAQMSKSAEDLEDWRRVAQVAYARNTDAAIEAYEKVDSLAPNDFDTTLALSKLYSRNGQTGKAIAAAEKANELAKDNAINRVKALNHYAAMLRRMGRTSEALQSADRAVVFAHPLQDGTPQRKVLLADALEKQSLCRSDLKNVKGAIESGEEAELLVQEAADRLRDGETYRKQADAAWNMISVYSAASQGRMAQAACLRMRAAAERAITLDRHDVLAAGLKFNSMWWEASLLMQQGKIPEARNAAKAAREAVEPAKKLDDKTARDQEYWAITIQARVEAADGLGTAAVQLLREAISIMTPSQQSETPSLLDSLRVLHARRELALALWGVNEKAEAIELVNDALTASRVLVEKEPASIENRTTMIQLMALAGEFMAGGAQSAEGLQLAEEAVRHAKTLAAGSKEGDFDDCLAEALNSLAITLRHVNEKDRAAAEYAKVIEVQRKALERAQDYPLAPFDMAGYLITYCDLLQEAGKSAEARAAAKEAVDICDRASAADTPISQRRVCYLALDRYADFFEVAQDFAGARAMLERCTEVVEASLARDPTNKSAQNDKRWVDQRLRKLALMEQTLRSSAETPRHAT